MSNSIWDRLPAASDIHCIEMKDQLQDRVASETRNVSADELVAYFRNASRRFWQEMGRACPTAREQPIKDTNTEHG